MAVVLHRDFWEMKKIFRKVDASVTKETCGKDFTSLRQPVPKYTSPSAQVCSFFCGFTDALWQLQRVRWWDEQNWVPLSLPGTCALCSFSRPAGGVSSSLSRAATLSLTTPASLAPGPVTLQKTHVWALSLQCKSLSRLVGLTASQQHASAKRLSSVFAWGLCKLCIFSL